MNVSLLIAFSLAYSIAGFRRSVNSAAKSAFTLEEASAANISQQKARLDRKEVYVMMPLTTMGEHGINFHQNGGNLHDQLWRLRDTGADGIMLDVWWGLTEREPHKYDFTAYEEIIKMAEDRNLAVQVVASFHQCGGNVGDDCDIKIPSWVRNVNGIWFKDQSNYETKEYISLFADDEVLHGGRTPIQMYGDWMKAFATAFQDKLGNTIKEIQVGMGPAGELRYPSYSYGAGWEWCGIGAFQAFDIHALKSFTEAAQELGKSWDSPPRDAGGIATHLADDRNPPRSGFIGGNGYKSEYGRFFLDWYSGSLKKHGKRILEKARAAFGDKVVIAGKIAGVHWYYNHPSHASELMAGYYNTNGRNAYAEIAQMFSEQGAALDFTCLEMSNREQDQHCMSNPEGLVEQVAEAARLKGAHFNGENALPRYDRTAYDKILQRRGDLDAFTYLRLTPELLNNGFGEFKNFVDRMHR